MRTPNYAKYLSIIELLIFEDLTHNEIVNALRCSYGTIQKAIKWYETEVEDYEDYGYIETHGSGEHTIMDFIKNKYKLTEKKVAPVPKPLDDLEFVSNNLAELNKWRVAYAILTGKNTSKSIREYKQAIFNLITQREREA